VDASIVIVSYNTCQILDECIASIENETTVKHEVIIVDNASTDNTCRMLRDKYPYVTLIENDHNVGFARANNQGFSIASGKYFFMLNPDTVILDGAIDKLVDFMEHNDNVGICGPRNIGRDGQLQYNCDHFPSVWNTLWVYGNLINRYPRVRMFRKSRMQYWDYGEMRDVERIAGCSLMIKSNVYKKLSGLDNKFFMYFEETDLCYRARRSGYRIVYLPSASILHYGGESSFTQTEQPVLDKTISSYYLRSQYYFYRKNYGFLPMLAIRSLDFVYGAALLGRNTARRDRIKRECGRAKGMELCTAALRY
jgi:GT2 family glycosyltransferase